MPENDDRKKLEQAASSLATTAAVGAARAYSTGDIEGTVLGAVFSTLTVAFSFALGAALQHRKDAGKRFVDGVAAAFREGTPLEDVEKHLRENATRPEIHEAVFESTRRFADAVTPDVAPVLGALLGSYAGEGLEPDPFFRGYSRFLADLGRAEFRAFRRLLELLQTHPGAASVRESTNPEVVFHLVDMSGTPGEPVAVHVYEIGGSTNEQRHRLESIDGALRIFHLLRLHGLGREMATGGFTGFGGPQVVILPRAIVKRAAYFARFAATAPTGTE